MKKLVFIGLVMLGYSCQKDYSCVCESVSKKKDTLMVQVRTTKLGSKGFKEDCIKNETTFTDLINCRLE